MEKPHVTDSAEQVLDEYEFLTPEESEALVRSLPQPTVGTYLDMFIWQFEYGETHAFCRQGGLPFE